MRQSGCTALLTAAVMAFGISASAQKTTPVHAGKGGSPHVKTAWVIDGANITIEYGQPQLKGRPDAQLMPPGQPWRTGADEAMQPSLTDVAPKKVSPEANKREAPAPLETVAAEGAKDGVSSKATMKEALSEKAQPAPERKPQD